MSLETELARMDERLKSIQAELTEYKTQQQTYGRTFDTRIKSIEDKIYKFEKNNYKMIIKFLIGMLSVSGTTIGLSKILGFLK